MIEWQAESGLFTIRIRGKQWYWIYKFELKTVTDILTTPKNIGRNKWRITTPGDLQSSDDYLHILQLRAQNKWVQKYWKTELTKSPKIKKFHIVSPQEVLSYNFSNKYQNLVKHIYLNNSNVKLNFAEDIVVPNFSKKVLYNNSFTNFLIRINNKKLAWQPFSTTNFDATNLFSEFQSIDGSVQKLNGLQLTRKNQINIKNTFLNLLKDNETITNKYVYTYNDYNETTRWVKRSYGSTLPLRLVKLPVSSKNDFTNTTELVELFRLRFGDNEATVRSKPAPHSTFLIMKQKRYTRKKTINPRYKFVKKDTGKATKIVKYSGKPVLLDNQIIVENDLNASKQYNFFKKKKKKKKN